MIAGYLQFEVRGAVYMRENTVHACACALQGCHVTKLVLSRIDSELA